MKTPVYATPSSIFSSTSEGILSLLETGRVKPVVDLKGFLHQHFPQRDIPSRILSTVELTDEEQKFISLLSHDHELSLPSLVSATGDDTETIIQLLTMLEIKGVVVQERPGEYILV